MIKCKKCDGQLRFKREADEKGEGGKVVDVYACDDCHEQYCLPRDGVFRNPDGKPDWVKLDEPAWF
jgi:hypothetical protein